MTEADDRKLRVARAHRFHGAFGDDAFGRGAETAARFFGTPQYIVGQTVAVIVWIALNVIGIIGKWDPYPFILLNLAFSTQAAYAAPLILLAQTRQADRDKASDVLGAQHREDLHAQLVTLIEQNTALTEQVHALCKPTPKRRPPRKKPITE